MASAHNCNWDGKWLFAEAEYMCRGICPAFEALMKRENLIANIIGSGHLSMQNGAERWKGAVQCWKFGYFSPHGKNYTIWDTLTLLL